MDDRGGRRASRLLLLIFLGTAFVINAYLARYIYGDNPLVGNISAAIGALILTTPILWRAIKDISRGHVHMNELVALAVLATFILGDFKTAGVISFFMLISLVIETRTAEGAHAAIENLIQLTPTVAHRIMPDGHIEEVHSHALNIGDRIRLLPGDSVPADARIVSGRTTLDESSITGESRPRDKGEGEEVFAGTQNLTGAIEARVTHVGDDTTIGRVKELILAAEQTKLPLMRIIDRYVGYYTPTVLMLAALVWFFTQDWSRVIALLVVSCPCALILATPTAMVAALSAAARLGLLVKDVADIEAASRISAFIFDKTGTLTTGKLGVARLAPRNDLAPSALLLAAASAEQLSNHPAAAAMVALAEETGLELEKPTDFHEEPGQGVRAQIGKRTIICGRETWLRTNGIDAPALAQPTDAESEGFSVIFIASDGDYLGWIGVQDQIRSEAKACLERLRELKIERIAMVSGDRASVTQRVAHTIGCAEFKAECLPQEKVDYVTAVRSEGYHVAVVGDGVNDAPALAAGDIGIAMGAVGSDVAIHSATVALMNNDLLRIPFLFRLSRGTRYVIHQNLGIGLMFILVGLILSGLGYLNPIVAAIMHNTGSLLVIFNSARLVRSGEELEQETREAP